MSHEKEIRASLGQSARNQTDSIITRWTIEHLDLTPKQVVGAIACAPIVYLLMLLGAVACQ